MVGRVWIGFSLLLHGCGRELLFAGVAMPLFFLRMIRRSDLPSCSLFFWVISVISDAFLLFSAYRMFYVSFLSILLTMLKKEKYCGADIRVTYIITSEDPFQPLQLMTQDSLS